MDTRRATGPLEVRAQGRTLSGPAIRYGDISPSHRERFTAGAFALDERVRWLDLNHNRDKVLAYTGAGLELRDTPDALMVHADLPPIPAADRALAGVASGQYRGFSVEFRAIKQRSENGIRVVEAADLVGVGLVDFPSYTNSRVEIRQRSGRTLRSKIPSGVDLACQCSSGECTMATFDGNVLADMIDRALAGEVVAGHGNFSESPLASLSSGTLRLLKARDGVDVEIDIPDSAVGVATLAAHEAAGVVIRPHLDAALSAGDQVGDVLNYKQATLRGIVVSSTDQREGWPRPEVVATPDDLLPDPEPRRRRRRWL